MSEPSALDARRSALVAVAAALATRDRAAWRLALTRAAGAVDHSAVDEVLLQSHLFIGFPDALEAMVLWREVSGSAAPAPYPEEPELWRGRGEEVCARVYGVNYQKLRQNVASLHPDFDRWMVEGGYGRVIGRPGLDLATRELCIAALLTVWNAPRQLHSHMRGALNAGATVTELTEAVRIARELAGPPARESADGLLERMRSGSESSVGGMVVAPHQPASPDYENSAERR